MRRIICALALGCALSIGAAAAAQAPDPIMINYHAYQAAQAAGDLAGAETAAEAAWRASETRDGAGGHTAIFAMNCAIARQLNNHVAQSLEPARRALEIAQSNASSGVDPLAARLLAGRAELAANAEGAETRLAAVINEAPAPGAISEFVYPAAVDLGRWGIAHERYPIARDAWTAAVLHAEGATAPPLYARGVALWGKGVSLTFLNKIDDAEAAFTASAHQLAAFMRDPAGDALTPGQAAYVQSFAWLATLRSKRLSEHPNEHLANPDIPTAIGVAPVHPVCALAGDTEPRPAYPSAALQALGVGAVILRVRTDASGAVTSTQVIASAPSPMFGDAVTRVKDHWRFRVLDTPAGCEKQGDRLLVERFGLRMETVMLPF